MSQYVKLDSWYKANIQGFDYNFPPTKRNMSLLYQVFRNKNYSHKDAFECVSIARQNYINKLPIEYRKNYD